MTDFGEKDFFVGSLHGVIVSINPLVRIVDITHHIPSFDILAGSFVLYAAYRYFPDKTIFLVIIDPGVGSSRRILLVETKNYYFVAPDNGVLSLVLEEEKITQIREVTNKKLFLPSISKTFEGRDKMAPAASWLSKNVPVKEFGSPVSQIRKIKTEKPKHEGNEIIGCILYEDRFGNLITNIPVETFERFRKKRPGADLRLVAKGAEIPFQKSYSSAKKGELLFLRGSLGLLEIAAREYPAAKELRINVGNRVKMVAREKHHVV